MSLIIRRFWCAVSFLLVAINCLAAEVLTPVKVTDNVWAIVGPDTNRNAENLGNNATFGLIVTDAGAILVDSGGSLKGAKRLHSVVKQITELPVKYVINTGGQDHRWFGNDYFAQQGAIIISSRVAQADQKARLNEQWSRIEPLVGKNNMLGTKERYADVLFDTDYQLKLGSMVIHIEHRGHAHTAGDSYVWLPGKRVIFSGDIVYTERMLNISGHSKSKSWLSAFEAMASYQPEHVVPGHGAPTSLRKATQDTYDYISFLRGAVSKFMEAGGDISDISTIDQTRFAYLKNYETLKGRNAQKVFSELEWE